MFSGIIKEQGTIVLNLGKRIDIIKPSITRSGDSIAVNGVCLTAVTAKKTNKGVLVRFDLSEETLQKTTLGDYKTGTKVNLEEAVIGYLSKIH